MPYTEMSDLALLELCIWREARGERYDGKRGVAHVIINRSLEPSWWNYSTAGNLANVILHPYQFSSFNATDPNEHKWPDDSDPSFAECCSVATTIMTGSDPDNTDGAVYYKDSSIGWPSAWGQQDNYDQTLAVGRLTFYKPKPANNAEDVSRASLGED